MRSFLVFAAGLLACTPAQTTRPAPVSAMPARGAAESPQMVDSPAPGSKAGPARAGDDGGLRTAAWAPLRQPAVADPVELILHWQRPENAWLRGDDPLAKGDVNWTASFETWTIILDSARGRREVPLTRAGGEAKSSSLYVQPTVSLTLSGSAATVSFDRKSVMTRVAEASVDLEPDVTTAVAVRGQLVWTSGKTLDFDSPPVTIRRLSRARALGDLMAPARQEAERLLAAVPAKTLQSGQLLPYGIPHDRDDGTRVVSFAAMGVAWRLERFDILLRPDGSIAGNERGQVFTCLGRGTPVSGPDGDVPVEALQVGHEVFAFDPASGRETTAQVLAVVERPARRTLRVAGGWLTPEHPVYADGVFAPLAEIGARPRLKRRTGMGAVAVTVADVRPVYDVVVAPPHTFYAGGVLVHNKSVAWSPSLGDIWRFAPAEASRVEP